MENLIEKYIDEYSEDFCSADIWFLWETKGHVFKNKK